MNYLFDVCFMIQKSLDSKLLHFLECSFKVVFDLDNDMLWHREYHTLCWGYSSTISCLFSINTSIAAEDVRVSKVSSLRIPNESLNWFFLKCWADLILAKLLILVYVHLVELYSCLKYALILDEIKHINIEFYLPFKDEEYFICVVPNPIELLLSSEVSWL